MNTDVLFDRAFAIRAAKPWQHLFDTHIFAVRFSDGEIACCSVMGRNGTHLALALYSLTDGLYALDKLMTTDMRVLPRHRAEECMLGQDCIQVSFENAQEILAKEAKPSALTPKHTAFPCAGSTISRFSIAIVHRACRGR